MSLAKSNGLIGELDGARYVEETVQVDQLAVDGEPSRHSAQTLCPAQGLLQRYQRDLVGVNIHTGISKRARRQTAVDGQLVCTPRQAEALDQDCLSLVQPLERLLAQVRRPLMCAFLFARTAF